jgi:hypothetical protein
MQVLINQNVGFTRNEMILEESLNESDIGRLLSQNRALRATRINYLRVILATLFGRHNAHPAQQALTGRGEQSHKV